MIKVVFTHFGPHFEELVAFLVFLLHRGEKYRHAGKVEHRFLLNANEVPGLPDGVDFSECIFMGIASKLKDELAAAGVPKDQIIDEHEGAGRDADSSFRKLLVLLGLSDNDFLTRWADALGSKDSGKSGDSFTIYRTLDAVYGEEVKRGGCEESVAWAKEIACAALECDDYFLKGERTIRAGRFFERLACVWACCRFGRMTKQEALEKFFFEGWEKCSSSFPGTLRRLGKAEDRTLAEIIRMTENGGLRSLGVLGLPRLMYSFYEKVGLERTASSLFRALDAERQSQERFAEAVEIAKQAKRIALSDGKTFALIVYSDNQYVNKAARFEFRERVAVVFQESNSPKKSVQIFSNGNTGASLSHLYQEILSEEKRREEEFKKPSPEKWHFLHGKTDIILNGSKSYPGVPPTMIRSVWFEENIPRLVNFPNRSVKNKAA